MKKCTLLATMLFLTCTNLFSQSNKFELTLDYSPSRSVLRLEGENAKSTNAAAQLGLRYQLFERWHLHVGVRYMLTGYETETVGRIFHDLGGVSTVTSMLEYKNLSAPIGASIEPWENLSFQFFVAPTWQLGSLIEFYEKDNGYDEKSYSIEGVMGEPKQFSLIFGLGAAYAIPISPKMDLRLGLRAMTSGNGLLKNESSLTRLTDVGGSIGVGYWL